MADKRKKKPKLLRHILTDLGIGLVVLAAIPLGTVYGGWHWVRGVDGRAWLAAEINALATREGIDAHITRITHIDSGRITLGPVHWRGTDGHSASIDALDLTFRPLALLRGRIEIEALHIGGAALIMADSEKSDTDDSLLVPAIAIPSLTLPDLFIGSLRIDGTAQRGDDYYPFTLRGHADLHPMSPFNSIVHLHLRSDDHDLLTLRLPDGVIRLDDANGILTGHPLQVALDDGWLSFDIATIARGTAALTLQDGRAPGLTLDGKIESLRHPAAPPVETSLRLHTDAAHLQLGAAHWPIDDDLTLSNPTLTLTAQRERGGTVALALRAGLDDTPALLDGGAVQATLNAQWDGRGMQVRDLRIANAIMTLNATGRIDPSAMEAALIVDAAVNGNEAGVDPFLTLRGPVRWAAATGVHFDAITIDHEQAQMIVSGRYDERDGLRGEASVSVLGDYNIETAFTLDRAGDDPMMRLSGLAFDLNGIAGTGTVDIATAARTARFDLSTALDGGAATLSGAVGFTDPARIALDRLVATYNGDQLHLDQPTHLRLNENGRVDADGLRLRLNDLPLTLTGMADRAAFDLTLTLPPVAADRVNLPLDRGDVSGRVRLHGPYDRIRGEGALSLRDGASGPLSPISADLNADYDGTDLNLEASLRSPAAMTLDGTATLPLSLNPFNLSEQTPINGRVRGQTTLEALSRLALIDGHVATGPLDVDITLGGTLGQPAPQGGATLRGGAYESLLYGTRLTDLRADLRFDRDGVSLHDLHAGDGNGWHVAGGGTVRIAPGGGAPHFDLNLTAERFRILSLPTLSAVAGAEMRLHGTPAAATLQGRASISRADLYLTRLQGGSDPYRHYKIVDAHNPAPDKDQQADPSGNLAIDLKISANNGIFVRGPGLDSEWAADLAIGGTAAAPRISGTLSTLRGRYDAFDLVMTLLPGTVQLDGGTVEDGALDLAATLRGRGSAQARLNATGTVRSPRIALTSESGAHGDDVLAELLFGRSMGDLSPMQALRVAQILAALAGQDIGTGFDPMGALRRGVGLDMLSVDLDDDGESRLSAGKYIADDVYLTIEQGTAPGSTRIRTEIDLTDRIKGEAAIGADADNSIGIKWQRDY